MRTEMTKGRTIAKGEIMAWRKRMSIIAGTQRRVMIQT